MRFIRPLSACTAAVLALSLAACTAEPTADDSDGGGGGNAAEYTSPLTPYYDALYSSGADSEQQQKKQLELNAKTEELVAACMKDQGFEYTPAQPDSQSERDLLNGVESDDDAEDIELAWKPDERAWVEKYGYGIVDWPGRVEIEQQAAAAADSNTADAGDEYYDSLSESQRAAYDEALHGPAVDKEAVLADENYEYKWEEAGCYGKAGHELEGEMGETFDPTEYQDLMDRMTALSDEIATDPEIAALDAEWATCMADAGESGFTVQADAKLSIGVAFDGLYNVADGGELTEMPDLSPDTNPEAAEIQKRELALALVDLGCREETSYQDTWEKVTNDREQDFLDANRAELDAMKLALEQAG